MYVCAPLTRSDVPCEQVAQFDYRAVSELGILSTGHDCSALTLQQQPTRKKSNHSVSKSMLLWVASFIW